jgi:hypothetical protein
MVTLKALQWFEDRYDAVVARKKAAPRFPRPPN